MNVKRLLVYITAALSFAIAAPAIAEIVYTPAKATVPVNGSFSIDLDGDGVADFTLTSKLIQGYCQAGDEDIWLLTVTPANGNAVISKAGQIGTSYASALANGAPVSLGQSFYPAWSTMSELYWGPCGTGASGEWLNTPTRYLGFRFRAADNAVHYGWARVSSIAYVDRHGNFQSSTILSGFAFETIPDQQILTGQTFDAP